MRPYSRYATLEERRNIRRTFIFAILTIGLLVLLFTFGFSAIAQIAGVAVSLRGGGKAVQKVDTTPPGPPHISPLPAYTNQQTISISGTSEPGATVTLFLNGAKEDVTADKDGNFSYSFTLNKGDNSVSAVAKDPSGNQGQQTSVYTVVFDNEPPTIDISEPADGASFSGSKQRQITISGSVTVGSTLTINDRLVMVNDDGTFSYLTSLSDGQNTFNIKAVDRAGNSAEKSLTVNFSS